MLTRMPFITPKRLAQILCVHPDSVARWVRNGQLEPALRTPGGQARFDLATILIWKPPRRGPAPAPAPPLPPLVVKKPWRPRRVWATKAKGQHVGGNKPAEPAVPRIDKTLFATRFEEHRRHAPQYYRLLSGEAAWRAKRRSEEYTAREFIGWEALDGRPFEEQRRELYRAAWARPIVALAKEDGTSDNALRKRYKRWQIPIPPRGYWAKRKSAKASKTAVKIRLCKFKWRCLSAVDIQRLHKQSSALITYSNAAD